jgi:glycosyltransferase involved in cell wall biosynthesis
VEFRGYLEEEEKRELLGSARALVYAAVNEDFGMVPIEAYASGTPVIGVRDGFTKYQIDDGKTGLLYDRGVQSLADAVETFASDGVRAGPEELRETARTYGLARFRESLRDVVARAVAESRIDVSPGAEV